MRKACTIPFILAAVFVAALSLSARGQTGAVNLQVETPDVYNSHNDSMAVRAYDSIYNRYQYTNPDTLIYFMKQGLTLFTNHKYKKGVADMLTRLGGIYCTLDMFENSEKAVTEALNIFTEINYKGGIANTNNILGIAAGKQGNCPEAIRRFLIALKIYESLGDTGAITDSYIKLGKANDLSNNPDKALEYYIMGEKMQQGRKVTDILIFLDNNIGALYQEKNDYPNALKYLQKAYVESNTPAFAQIHILPLENLSAMYSGQGDTAKAMYYLQQAMDIAVKQHLPTDYASILTAMARLQENKHPEKAIELLNDALQTARTTGEKSTELDVLDNLIPLYKARGKYMEAFDLLEQEKDISDSMLNINKQRTMANMEALYDLDKLNTKVQHLAVAEAQQKHKTWAFIAIAVVLCIFSGIVGFFLLKTRRLNHELSNREAGLHKANAIRNKLISIVSHDLIGSIGFMPVALRLSRDSATAPAVKDNLLKQLEVNATSAYETLQNMLDWGKTQIQGVKLKQATIDVTALAAEVLQFTHAAAANKQINIDNNIPPGTLVHADPNHFKFIFRNLLSNAIKYSHPDSKIEIGAHKSPDGSLVIFSVKDYGIGISKDSMAGIFGQEVVSVIGTHKEKGNGIGLNLCKEFAKENGGDLWVDSKSGEGSVFYFSFSADYLGV
jgi:tetratricopeptide (TPR) repeat protein